MTRQQQYLLAAIESVGEVRDADDQHKKLSRAYGGLCHKIPALVLNDGLAQTVAWIEEKQADPHNSEKPALSRAYGFQRAHIAQRLGILTDDKTPDPGRLADAVKSADNTTYMRYTLTLLDAWIYHKRFAASLLGVKSASEVEELDESDGVTP